MKNFDLLIPSAPQGNKDSWLWATVVGTGPLRIRLDGDENPLSITPESLVNGLQIGHRVWVQMQGRRVIVHGSNAGSIAGVSSLHRDPSFETGTGGAPGNEWSTFWATGGSVFSYDTSDFIQGSRSVKLTVPANGNARLHSNTIFPVVPGAVLNFSFWAKGLTAGVIGVAIMSQVDGNPDFFNGRSDLLQTGNDFAITTSWQKFSFSMQVPTGHTVARLTIAPVSRDASPRTYWVDATQTEMTLVPSTGSSLPTGSIQMFAGTTAPAGYLFCRGGSFDRKVYPTLAAVLGDTYGTHSGDTYYLPNFDGRSPIGVGPSGFGNSYSLGQKWGHDKMQSHDHPAYDSGHSHGTTGRGTTWEANNPWGGNDVYYPVSAYGGGSPGGNYLVTGSGWNGTHTSYANIDVHHTGGGNAENVHPVLGMNFIIKT